MTSPRIEIDYRAFAAALRALGSSSDDPARLIRDGVDTIAAAARPPIQTGRLAASKTIRIEPGSGEVAWTAPYARFVHYGTKHMSADPFAAEAIEKTEPRVVASIEAGLEDLIGRSGLR